LKIQVLSQSFYPDHSGISLYSSEFAFYAAEKGHEVEVITGFGFYPYWQKRKEDRAKLLATEVKGKVKILRGYIYVPKNPTTFKRIVHEISLLTSASINFFRAKKPDVIVVFITPILLGFLTAVFKQLYNCKLVINVQDFQLEAASSLHMTKRNYLYSILSAIERISYKSADLVTSISNSMYDILRRNKNLNEAKIDLWPNWIEKQKFIGNTTEKGLFRKKHNVLPSDKIIAYAGNVGLKQGVETLVDLAILFANNPGIKFFIVGEGSARDYVVRYAEEKKVQNVVFLSLLDATEYVHFLNDIDIFLLPQKKTEFDVYFPSKLLGLMAAKKIILLHADKDCELYKTIKSNNIGFVTEYGDIKALENAVHETLFKREKRDEIQQNAEKYVANFDRDLVLNRVLDKISRI
jgi:colanic acid biosynthesis glycosyl transferase WcaI